MQQALLPRRQLSRRQKRLGNLLLSTALLVFLVGFLKFSGDHHFVPGLLERSYLGLRSHTGPALDPPVVLQQCNWGDTHRHNLVITIVGDTSEHTRWLEGSESANWDLAVIYYGRLGASFVCEKCMHIELGYGAKWKLVHQFTQSGPFAEHYIHRYTQVYIPDDDIIQLPSSISRAFDIQEIYGLELAQPTLCSRIESETVHGVGLYKEGPTVLRYVTFVEIMVPLFSMDFFKGHVVNTLATSASGHGLDWVWPFLLGYPQEKIAYIDEVCIIHPRKSLQREGKVSMYDTNPTMLGWQTEEEKVQFKRFGYTPQASKAKYDVGYLEKARLGQIWQPWYTDLMQQAHLSEHFVTKGTAHGPKKGMQLVLTIPASPLPWEWPEPNVTLSPAKKKKASSKTAEMVIVLVVQEGRQPRWTQTSMDMPWHLVVVAADDMGYVNCPHCLFTHRYSSNETVGRYQLLYRLTQTQQWAQLVAGKHKYVYFPDEAVVQDVSAMSTLLRLSMENNLDLAHLSWCSGLDSQSDHMIYMQILPVMILRYGTYIDVAAPIFSWTFFQEVALQTLEEAQTGDNLGWLWPYLADYPRKKIAVIDAQCAMKPGAPRPSPVPFQQMQQLTIDNVNSQPIKAGNMLERVTTTTTTVVSTKTEGQYQLEKFAYDPYTKGKAYKTKQVMDFIEQPWYRQLLTSGDIQAVPISKWQMTAVRTKVAVKASQQGTSTFTPNLSSSHT